MQGTARKSTAQTAGHRAPKANRQGWAAQKQEQQQGRHKAAGRSSAQVQFKPREQQQAPQAHTRAEQHKQEPGRQSRRRHKGEGGQAAADRAGQTAAQGIKYKAHGGGRHREPAG